MSQVESTWILQLQRLESQAGVPSRDPSASPERSGVEDMRQKFNQRSSRSTLVLKQISVVGAGRPGKRDGNAGDSRRLQERRFPTTDPVRVVKIPHGLPHPPTNFHPKENVDSHARTQRCRHLACPRARSRPTCVRMTCPLHVFQPRVCKRDWNGGRFRCCVQKA